MTGRMEQNMCLEKTDQFKMQLPGQGNDVSLPSRQEMLEKVRAAVNEKVAGKTADAAVNETSRDLAPHTIQLEDGTIVSLLEGDVPQEKLGGSYRDVHVPGEGDQYEVHHIPADSTTTLEREDGPAIKMEKADHRQTASCGMSQDAQDYRNAQKELVSQGKFREAMQMDIDDIHEKFEDKYDNAISQMLEYVDNLEREGKI